MMIDGVCFQIAVAAAIGVGAGGEFRDSGFRTQNPLAARMRNKLGPRVPHVPRRGQTVAGMGEINRSIEKMSLDGGCGTAAAKQPGGEQLKVRGGPGGNTQLAAPNRRDSSWTVSTEGYGSMRSNTSASRRCSELSQVDTQDIYYLLLPTRDNNIRKGYKNTCVLRCLLCPVPARGGRTWPRRGTRSARAARGGLARPGRG